MDAEKQRIRILLSYEGTDFSGWQRQALGQRTIQDSLEKALSQLFNEPITVIGSGRTDARVHAHGQVAHFDTSRDIAKYDFLYALRGLLPRSIGVRKAWLAPRAFHARNSAVRKTYRYRILNAAHPSPFLRNYALWIRRSLDVERLNSLVQPLVGTHDFKSFQTGDQYYETTVRTIEAAQWQKKGPVLTFSVTGNGFLTHMVRNIVGTTLNLDYKGESPKEMTDILAAKDRKLARATAEPQGLLLYQVEYPHTLDIQCRKI